MLPDEPLKDIAMHCQAPPSYKTSWRRRLEVPSTLELLCEPNTKSGHVSA